MYIQNQPPLQQRGEKSKERQQRRAKKGPVLGSVFYTLYSIFCFGILQKMYVLTGKLIWYQYWPIIALVVVVVVVWVWEAK